jgi:hypothetical protein
MKIAACSSETPVIFYQPRLRYIPEDSNEIQISHTCLFCLIFGTIYNMYIFICSYQ